MPVGLLDVGFKFIKEDYSEGFALGLFSCVGLLYMA